MHSANRVGTAALPPPCVLPPAEQLLLTKLKTECGYQFTSKLETMFGDIKLSRWVYYADAWTHYVAAGWAAEVLRIKQARS